ncbi:putative membrane protein [Tamilnaduibacter salinus]|uniref:Branched-chain amino acid transporter n=1 Tax=Tamilnaduibacter salinus TaxID=1484056 RepID=A0A2A2I0X7_9GAMM|nr:AzlD domain-containing protein [Tamilnaduibacter salinus]PAV25262.1 branched-chain amino acid transporter [Tamilnaduibacter salinus]PVY69986.1 putative membrane protein [Tamilnaduibacter salinus]
MAVETTPFAVIAIIILMALVTLATRLGGVFAMSFVRIRPGVERFINAMASSVLIAVVVPMAVSGDAGARAALGATTAVMLLVGRPMPAITAGLVTAASVRYLVGA